MTHLDSGVPHLVVLEPHSDLGRRIPLAGDYLIVGREPSCDVRFNDPHVSRTHAALRRRGNAVYVEDLGSSGGTFVNGATASAARELQAGDVLTFATVAARLEAGGTAADQTRTMTAVPVPRAAPDVRIGGQNGGIIGNAAGDQYISYVNQQRENFLREVAATRTKARWLAWTGFLAFLAGFGLFGFADLSFLKEISNEIQNGDAAPPTINPFGREVGGVPLGLIGWALAAVGMVLLIVGIALHIIATSRRRRADREFPVPPPWPGANPMRR
jgi:hypothetical protein